MVNKFIIWNSNAQKFYIKYKSKVSSSEIHLSPTTIIYRLKKIYVQDNICSPIYLCPLLDVESPTGSYGSFINALRAFLKLYLLIGFFL